MAQNANMLSLFYSVPIRHDWLNSDSKFFNSE